MTMLFIKYCQSVKVYADFDSLKCPLRTDILTESKFQQPCLKRPTANKGLHTGFAWNISASYCFQCKPEIQHKIIQFVELVILCM